MRGGGKAVRTGTDYGNFTIISRRRGHGLHLACFSGGRMKLREYDVEPPLRRNTTLE
jgi:hypothetical protein